MRIIKIEKLLAVIDDTQEIMVFQGVIIKYIGRIENITNVDAASTVKKVESKGNVMMITVI